MTRRVADAIIIERIVFAGFVAMFLAGGITWALTQLWAPLIYVFWVAWPLITWLLFLANVAPARCGQCLTRARMGAIRCRACAQLLD